MLCIFSKKINLISKGSSVIRMLERMLDEEVFRIGVNTCLKRFAFNNADTDDLWAELQTATQNTVNVEKVKKLLISIHIILPI